MEALGESEDLKLSYLFHERTFFSGKVGGRFHMENLLELGAETKRRVRRKVAGEDLVPQRWGTRGNDAKACVLSLCWV